MNTNFLNTGSSARTPKVVFFGGGGGAEAVLRALWTLDRRVVAIIGVHDDGSDSGRIRAGLGWAPGDSRRALVAMAAKPDATISRLVGVRIGPHFPDREGQSFGNTLFVAAAEAGLDMLEQIRFMAHLLGVTGTVLPSTLAPARMVADMEDGTTVHGETAVAAYPSSVRRVRLDPAQAAPTPGAPEAVLRADCIVIGPGSVTTSLIPTLLPCASALAEAHALRILIAPAWVENAGDPPSASDYVRLVAAHHPQRLFDVVLCHVPSSGGQTGGDIRRPVVADLDSIRRLGYAAVGRDLIGPCGKHNGPKTASVIMELLPGLSHRRRQAVAVQGIPGDARGTTGAGSVK